MIAHASRVDLRGFVDCIFNIGRNVQNIGTFYLIEDVPKFTKFMSEPIKMVPGSSPLDTPGYFLAGILKGYLASAGFAAECVSAMSGIVDVVG